MHADTSIQIDQILHCSLACGARQKALSGAKGKYLVATGWSHWRRRCFALAQHDMVARKQGDWAKAGRDGSGEASGSRL